MSTDKTYDPYNRFLIHGPAEDPDEHLFWSNDIGWVDKDSATIFSSTELYSIHFPITEEVVIAWIDDNNEIFKFHTLEQAFGVVA